MNSYTDISLRICLFGLKEYDEGGRTWTLRTGLHENGFLLKYCQTDVRGFLAKYRDLYRTWKKISHDVDALYVVFMGYYFIPLAWYCARRKKIPIILDALVSQYDTEVIDRKRVVKYSPRAWFLWGVDFISCFVADAIVVDTFANKNFFAEKFFVNKKKIIVVPVGCRSDIFKPLLKDEEESEKFIVEFHGSFIPLQGIEYIMEAARILQDKRENVHFVIIGKGQTFEKIFKISQLFHLTNVEFFDRMPLKKIADIISRSHLCLGIFGTTKKALRVIPHKVYDCLSSGKPVITERSPAILERLHDRKDIYMVEPGNGRDLAEKILELKNDPQLRFYLAKKAREISQSIFSPQIIVKDLVDWLKKNSAR